jgi:hypothetical protein
MAAATASEDLSSFHALGGRTPFGSSSGAFAHLRTMWYQ